MLLNNCSQVPLKSRLREKLRRIDPRVFNRLLIVAGLTGLLLEAGLLLMISQMSSDDIASAQLPGLEQPVF